MISPGRASGVSTAERVPTMTATRPAAAACHQRWRSPAGVPECSAASAGHVCHDGTNVVVKGLAEAFGLDDANAITLKKHLIPDTNAAYDLGNAEYKIRHMFLSDT